jgi:signal transduction histidine kinase
MTAPILIVDDNSINRQLLKHILADHYHPLDEAEDGQECLDKIKQHTYELVLLDLNMPNKSGSDVLQELQTLALDQTPTVIVISADNKPETISHSLQLGAADYITPPYSREELLARVKNHLTLRNREQDLEERVQARTRELELTNKRLRKTQQQLAQAEKMASLGELAAGVAHEINNPIAYINANLGSLRDYVNDLIKLLGCYQQAEAFIEDDSTRRQLTDIQQSIDLPFLKDDIQQLIQDSLSGSERVQQIVSDLKVFSQPQQSEWQQLRIDECIHSVLNIITNEIKYKAEVSLELAETPPIDCIITQIYQVMTNILVNAAQAIEKHGQITITTENAAQCPFDQKLPAPGILINVQDSGSGMSKAVQKKIFNPFFTTKPPGQGTGLGLSVTYGIIGAHQGGIDVESKPGQGTRFTLYLPLQQSGSNP